MANLDKALIKIAKWEGGYANDQDDTGGPTMCGVTLTTYKEYCRKKGLPTPTTKDLKNISSETVRDVAKTLYWDPIKGDEIHNQSIAALCFDSVWGSGLTYIKKIQEVLGVTADGKVGPVTIRTINEWDPQSDLFRKLWERRRKFFEGCSTYWKYGRGWMNRLRDYTFEEEQDEMITVEAEEQLPTEPVIEDNKTQEESVETCAKKSLLSLIIDFFKMLFHIK